MADAEPQDLGLLAKPVIAFAQLAIISGTLWYGVTVAAYRRL